MRNVKVAAIQPGRVDIPEPYYYASPNYVNDPEAIWQAYVSKQLDVSLSLLEQAGAQGCDVVVSCEDAGGLSAYGMDITEKNVFPALVSLAQPRIEGAFSALACKHAMYVIGCYHTWEQGKIYNTAAIFDRRGQIVGQYRKTHLPSEEKWQSTPGDRLDVFTLDFGTIGISICYDMIFPEAVQILALQGAEILFHPTFGYGWYDSIGEATLRARANDNGLYIVTAKNYQRNRAGKSSIIDPWGQVLVDAGFYQNVIVYKEIDLDAKKAQPDWYFPSALTGLSDVTQRTRRERRPELYGGICEENERLEEFSQERKLEILKGIKEGRYHW